MTFLRSSTLASLVTGAVLSCAAAGAAMADSTTPSIAVRYSSADLSSDAGTSMVYRKIVRAAHQVCPESEVRDLRRRSLGLACERDAIERAVRQIDSSRLAAKLDSTTRKG